MNHGPIWAAAAFVCLIGQTAVVLQASCEASVGDHLLVNCTNRGPHISVTWFQWQSRSRGNDKATPVRLLSATALTKWTRGQSPVKSGSHSPSICCSLRLRKKDHKPREGNEDRKLASPTCVSSLPNEASPSHTDADARIPLGVYLPEFMPGDFSVVTCQGSNVTMVCDVQGQGTSVSWNRRSNTDTANVHLLQGDTLELEDVKKEDGGFYFCEVNGSDADQSVITRELILSVEYPPVISVPAMEVRGSSSDSCSLHCVVEAFPEAIVTWYKEDVQLGATSDVRYQTLLETNGNCTLRATLLIRIPNDTNSANDSSSENENASRNFGNYTCVAENKHGRTSAVLRLVAPNLWDSRTKDEEEEGEPRRFNVTGFIIGMMPPIFISFYIILKLGYRSRYAQEHPEDEGGREEPFFVSY